jgi:hypothetical protein
MDCRIRAAWDPPRIEFTWHGFDEGDELTGRGLYPSDQRAAEKASTVQPLGARPTLLHRQMKLVRRRVAGMRA